MITFNKAVSWSRFKQVLNCGHALERSLLKLDPEIYIRERSGIVGTLVQRVFALYFNNGLNLTVKGRDPKVLVNVLTKKVIDSAWAKEEQVVSSMVEEAIPQLEEGYRQFVSEKIIHLKIESEVAVYGTLRNHRISGMVDFLVDLGEGYLLYDGKGSSKTQEDERQVLYYALALHAVNKRVVGGGFLYWKHGFRTIDLSSEGIHRFINGDFEKGRTVFQALKTGLPGLPPVTSFKNCMFCRSKKLCPYSYFRKPVVSEDGGMGITEV